MVTFSDLLFAIAAEVVERSLFPRAETGRTFFSNIDMAILLHSMSQGSCRYYKCKLSIFFLNPTER